jgi:hypothetical protein
MAIFYLHLSNALGETEDEEGVQAETLAEAREVAIRGIRSLISAEAQNGAINLNGRIDIRDEARQLLLSVPFSDAITISAP